MKKLARATIAIALAIAVALLSCGCAALLGSGSSGSQGGAGASGAVSVSSTVSVSGVSGVSMSSAGAASADSDDLASKGAITATVSEDGEYTDKDSVALYIHTFGHLPSNFVSKTKARKAGWVSTEGNLWEVLPGKSIGGSEFYNDDGQLPEAPGRRWTECDIGYAGGYRGSERIVFSNDGLVFYTPDHYNTFEQLY